MKTLILLWLSQIPRISAQIDFGTASPFAVLGSATITNTGASVITGDIGTGGSSITGFFPSGTYTGNAYTAITSPFTDATAVYDDLAGRSNFIPLSGNLGNRLLVPGVYRYSSDALLTGDLTLQGTNSPSDIWIFQIGSALTTASSSRVLIVNSQPCRVFWQIGSSATLGTDSLMVGNIFAAKSITATTRVESRGSLFALDGAVTLDTNIVGVERCAAVSSSSAGGEGGGSTATPVSSMNSGVETGVPPETSSTPDSSGDVTSVLLPDLSSTLSVLTTPEVSTATTPIVISSTSPLTSNPATTMDILSTTPAISTSSPQSSSLTSTEEISTVLTENFTTEDTVLTTFQLASSTSDVSTNSESSLSSFSSNFQLDTTTQSSEQSNSIETQSSTSIPSTTSLTTSLSPTSTNEDTTREQTFTTSYTISTIYTTKIYTITSCAPTITNCPAKLGKLTTETISLTTTLCPLPTTSIPQTISTIYTTHIYTIVSCAATITDCPARLGKLTTEIISLTTTLCTINEEVDVSSTTTTTMTLTVTAHPGLSTSTVTVPQSVEGCTGAECEQSGLSVVGNNPLITGDLVTGSEGAQVTEAAVAGLDETKELETGNVMGHSETGSVYQQVSGAAQYGAGGVWMRIVGWCILLAAGMGLGFL